MRAKALSLLGLMRKANALSVGETDTGAACRAQDAKLLILAKDASENAKSRAKGFVYGRGIPMIELPFTKDEISVSVGKSGCSMAAVCDLGLADAFLKILSELLPGEYSEARELVFERLRKEKQRSKEAKAHEINRKKGLRRNNA